MFPQDLFVTITVAAVTRSLNNLIYTASAPQDTDLLHLRLVDAWLHAMRMPPTVDYRRFALEQIITDLLIAHFHDLNRLFQLPIPAANAPYPTPLASIARYGETGNRPRANNRTENTAKEPVGSGEWCIYRLHRRHPAIGHIVPTLYDARHCRFCSSRRRSAFAS